MADPVNQLGDSPELEALFDSIVAQQVAPAPAPLAVTPSSSASAGDSDELQALFDSVASQQVAGGAADCPLAEAGTAAAGAAEAWAGQEQTFNRIGQMARQLHDALLGLGYDKLIEKTVSALPDAKDRLAYVANLTEQAACRVLNATDIAKPAVEQVEADGARLAAAWDRLYARQMSVEEFRELAGQTREFLGKRLPAATALTNAQLMEIMMAQDFQDLTGQVIKKIVALAQELEQQMMTLLIDVMPDVRKTESVSSLLNGPVISAEGRQDVVVNQTQVDDLLDSLGF